MKNTDTIYLSKSDLNYNGGTISIAVTRERFFKMQKFDGRYLIQRIRPTL